MTSIFRRSDFGPGRAATGGDLDREVTLSSDLATQTGVRNVEYEDLARALGGIVQSMKALAGIVQSRNGGAIDGSYTEAAQKALSKAKRLIIKAETEDAADRDEGDEDPAEEIERLLKRAKRLLLQAHEADEDTDDISAAYTKARVSLATLKSKPVTVAAAKADAGAAATQKAVAALDAQCTALQGGLAECVALLAKRSGVASPMSHIMKAVDTGPAIPSNTDIAQAVEAGTLTTAGGIQAKVLRNLLQQGATKEVKDRLAKTNEEGIRHLFDAFR